MAKKKISEKNIGRRVVVNGQIDGQTFVKEPGVLKYSGDDFCRPGVRSYTVEFDKPREVLHDCLGKAKDKHGFWIPESMITFTDEENKMEIYKEKTKCKKCGHDFVSTQYQAIPMYGPCQREHIIRTCERCGYRWNELPLDAQEQK